MAGKPEQHRDDLFADIGDLILNVSRELREAGQAPGSIPLTMTEGNVMRHIDRYPGSATTAVAIGTGLQRTNLSATLRSLEEKGLVSRRLDAADGRVVRLFPTELAGQNLAALRLHWVTVLAPSDVTTEQAEQAHAALVTLELQLKTARMSDSGG